MSLQMNVIQTEVSNDPLIHYAEPGMEYGSNSTPLDDSQIDSFDERLPWQEKFFIPLPHDPERFRKKGMEKTLEQHASRIIQVVLEQQPRISEPEPMSKMPFLARVERFGDTRVRCMVNFKGVLLPVSFPKAVIDCLHLNEGDEFEWSPPKGGRTVRTAHCKPINHRRSSQDEQQRWKEIISDLPSFDEPLPDF